MDSSPTILDYIIWFFEGMWQGILNIFTFWHIVGIIIGVVLFNMTFNRRKK